jgi:hypothetical protein
MTPSLVLASDPQTNIPVFARRGVQQSGQAATVKAANPQQRLLTDPELLPFNLPSGTVYLIVPKPVPTWLQPILDTLTQFAWLPANWDTYGGIPATSKALFASLHVISRLMTDTSTSPATVPTSEGGIQFEWYRGPGDELSIGVAPSGEISLFRVNERAGEMIEHDDVKLDNLSSLVTSLIGRL